MKLQVFIIHTADFEVNLVKKRQKMVDKTFSFWLRTLQTEKTSSQREVEVNQEARTLLIGLVWGRVPVLSCRGKVGNAFYFLQSLKWR